MPEAMLYSKKDLILVRKRCRVVLKNRRPLPEVSAACHITILVPVYDEAIHRIKKQIDAFSKQQLSKDKFELVYVVNNPKPDGSREDARVVRANKKIMRFLRRRQPLAVRCIDLSSPGNELKVSNVGAARNFGLHAVALRYLDQGRDGIVIHTDADSAPSKRRYLNEVLKEVSDPKCFGVAGGVDFVLDIDSRSKADKEFFRKHFAAFRKYMEWHALAHALNQQKHLKEQGSYENFAGAHMICKAIAGVLAGGIPALARAEDGIFGINLHKLAKKYGAYILVRKDEWLMRTAFRESRRTGTGYGAVFANVKKTKGKPLVRDVHAPHYYREFVPKIMVAMGKTKGRKKELADLLGDDFTKASKPVQNAIVKLAKRMVGVDARSVKLQTYDIWRDEFLKIKPESVLFSLYKKKYPLVPLTDKALRELRREVHKNPKLKSAVRDATKFFGQFRLPNKRDI